MKIVDRYYQCKKILEVVFDADRNDELTKTLRELTIEDLLNMQRFVRECEDAGIKHIRRVD